MVKQSNTTSESVTCFQLVFVKTIDVGNVCNEFRTICTAANTLAARKTKFGVLVMHLSHLRVGQMGLWCDPHVPSHVAIGLDPADNSPTASCFTAYGAPKGL